jgi:L-fuconolactonase
MIFDAHCHAWRRWPYDRTVHDPESRGSAEALLYEMDTHGVDRAAIVCARIGGGAGGEGFANEDNNDYVVRFAAAHPDRITPIIDVDCVWRPEHHTAGAAERLAAEADRTGAIGFTHYVTPQNDGWFATPDAHEFFRAAADRGLIASLAATAPWFADLRLLAAANPSMPILLHHMSHPGSQRDIDALLALADLPNVGVKISGFNYVAENRWEFPYPHGRQVFRALADAFGPWRLYWGSDFPASRDDLTYRQAIEVVRSHAHFLDASGLSAVLGDSLAALLARPRLATTSDSPITPNRK